MKYSPRYQEGEHRGDNGSGEAPTERGRERVIPRLYEDANEASGAYMGDAFMWEGGRVFGGRTALSATGCYPSDRGL